MNPSAPSPTAGKGHSFVLFAIVLAASILRIGGIGAESFWHDEALTTTSTRVPVTQVVHSVRYSENCPPGYFLLVNLWAKFTPETEAWLRFPSAIIGIAGIIVVHQLGRELFDARVGLTAAALLALLPFHIAYSQEARPYALLFLSLALCTWSFVRVLRSGSARWQNIYVICAICSLYIQTFAIFTIAALNLYFALLCVLKQPTGVSVRRWLTLQAAVIVLFGPWIPATIEVAQMGLPWMIHATPFHVAMAAYTGGLIALGVLGAACLFALGRGWNDRRVWLIALIAIVPVLGPCLYGVFTPRYGIGALIGLTLLAAYAGSQLGRVVCIALVLIAAVNWFTTSSLGHPRYPEYTLKPDIRAADRFIINEARPGDVVINLSDQLNNRAINYYLAGSPFHRVDRLPSPPPDHLWAIASKGAAPSDLPYTVLSSRTLDGVDLLELRLNSPQTAPATEPVAEPKRSD